MLLIFNEYFGLKKILELFLSNKLLFLLCILKSLKKIMSACQSWGEKKKSRYKMDKKL